MFILIDGLYNNQKLSQTSIDKILGFSMGRTYKLMKKLGIPARSDREKSIKYSCNEAYFSSIDTEEKAYWLGFLYADGYIQSKRKHSSRKVGISLKESDFEHLKKFSQAIGYNGSIHHYVSKSSYADNCEYCRLLISAPQMADDLIAKGCIEHKTDCVLFPDENIVPLNLMRHFVRGYFDGNGCITHGQVVNGIFKDYRIKLVAPKEFLLGFLTWIGKPEITLCKRHKDRKTNTYDITIGGTKQVKHILDLLYRDCAVSLDRKYKQYLQFIEQTKE